MTGNAQWNYDSVFVFCREMLKVVKGMQADFETLTSTHQAGRIG